MPSIATLADNAACSGVLLERPESPCPSGILKDLVDMLILMIVFIFGWMLFRPGSQLALAALRFCGHGLPAKDAREQPRAPGSASRLRGSPASGSAEAAAAPAATADARLRTLAARADLAACWGLWRAMPPGAALSGATCDALASALEREAATPADIDSAVQVAEASGDTRLAEAALVVGGRLRGAAWLARELARLYAAGLPRRPEHVAALARAYGRESRADLAVDLWCHEQRAAASGSPAELDVHASEELYTAALEACVSAGDLDAASRLARDAAWRSPQSHAGQQALLALARWLARRQDLVPARSCVAAVRAVGGRMDLPTLRALVAAAARSADMTRAQAAFEEITAEGLEPDLRTYSAMIRGYCAVGSVEQAMPYLACMRSRGVFPDITIFDAILDACACRSLLSLADEVIAEMEAAAVHASNMTLAILVRLYGSRGELARAFALFEELPRRYQLEVNAHAHGALVAACLAVGRRDLALQAFARMANAGCRPSARTFEGLIASCASNGELDEAVRLVDDALGLSPHTLTGGAGAAAAAVATPMSGAAPSLQRALLEPKVVEDLLRLIGRRGQAHRLGAPLVRRLQSSRFAVSEDLAEAILRSAQSGGKPPPSPLELRCAERHRWCSAFAESGMAAAAAGAGRGPPP